MKTRVTGLAILVLLMAMTLGIGSAMAAAEKDQPADSSVNFG